jgi:CheY-like chemotaxis protein
MARILVVDDEAIVRQLFAKVLQSAGHDVIVAPNGRDGILRMEEAIPDLVLLDLVMPVMDGMAFLRVLRRRPEWKQVPVIIVSGVVDRQQVLKAGDLGVQDYLLKCDFAMDELRARLAKYVPTHLSDRHAVAVPEDVSSPFEGPPAPEVELELGSMRE